MKMGLTWPFYLLIYTPHPSTKSTCSCQTACVTGLSYHGTGWDGHTRLKHTHARTHAPFPINTSDYPPPFLFYRSFSLVIHKSAKCPFQAAHKHPHRSPKMPPHSEARAVDGSEPTAAGLLTGGKWWMSEGADTLKSARQGQWIRIQGSWCEKYGSTVKCFHRMQKSSAVL